MSGIPGDSGSVQPTCVSQGQVQQWTRAGLSHRLFSEAQSLSCWQGGCPAQASAGSGVSKFFFIVQSMQGKRRTGRVKLRKLVGRDTV